MELAGITVKIILVFTILLDTILLLLVYSKNRKDTLYRLLLIYLLSILGWSISILMVLENKSPIAPHLAFATALVLSVSKFFFIVTFPAKKMPTFSILYFMLIPAIGALIFSFIPGVLFSNVVVIDNYYISFENGPYGHLYSAIITFFLVTPLVILYRKYIQQPRQTLPRWPHVPGQTVLLMASQCHR